MDVQLSVDESAERAPTSQAPLAPERLDGPSLEENAECLIGVSAHVAQLKKFVQAQANRAQPILFVGEPGLRQEQLASATHRLRGLPPDAFYSFSMCAQGSEAIYDRLYGPTGLLETQRAGTIFIEGVADLSNVLQYRLALSIEEQHKRIPAGEPTGWRLIFATEALPKSVAEGAASHHLLTALQSFRFTLKPLRERSEDLPYLAAHLVENLCRRLDKGAHLLTAKTLKLLCAYPWPGNIDELAAVLESAVTHTPPTEISDELLPQRIRYATLETIPEEGIDLFRVVEDYERFLITTALRQAGEVQTKAARLLGLRVQTLNMKLKRWGAQRQQRERNSTAETEISYE
jgi:DNA-binding NtrC family response regulator